MPDSRHELQCCEERGGQDPPEVQCDADSVEVLDVVVAFAWRGTVGPAGAEDAAEVEILETREGESEKGACGWLAGFLDLEKIE